MISLLEGRIIRDQEYVESQILREVVQNVHDKLTMIVLNSLDITSVFLAVREEISDD